jgi:uncharacterized membrane protein HdeD (DUF308 family)
MASKMANNAVDAVNVASSFWWVVLIEGIFALLIGLFLIADPVITTVFLVTVLGFYLLMRGVIDIVQIFTGRTDVSWGWLLFSGIVGIIAGLVVLHHPLYAAIITGSILVIFVAAAALVNGVLGVVLAFIGAGWGVGILAVLSIIISILLFMNLLVVTAVLPYIIAGFLIVGGIVGIVASFSLRNALR